MKTVELYARVRHAVMIEGIRSRCWHRADELELHLMLLAVGQLDSNTPDAACFAQLQLPAAALPNAETPRKAQRESCSDKGSQLFWF
jgi:hypothetical protein